MNAAETHGNSKKLKSVLIARFSALGDVAMTVPAVYSACRCYPDVRFYFVTRPSMTSIFVNAPDNLTLIGADVKNEYEGIGGLRALCNKLTAECRPDIFIDLHNVLRTKVMSFFLRLSGIKTVRIFKPRAKRRALTRPHNKVMLPLISQRARYREAFFKAGLPLTEHFNGLYSGRSCADTAAFAAITPPKAEGERWVALAPFAAHPGKIYPPELTEQVLAMLQADVDAGANIRVFLFGGGNEECEILQAWEKRYACATSLAGKRYGFAAELALFNHIDVAMTMDSANMHLASLASTPTISIWGATHPYCGFKAWRQTDDDTVQLPMDCRPCSVFGNKPCMRGDLMCLKAIKPAAIYKKLSQHL